jgi:WD40 repeat protein
LQTNVYLFSGIYGISLAFSPDGKYLAFGYSVWLYDFEKIKQKIEAASTVPQDAPPLPVTIIYPNPTHDVIQLKFSLDAPQPTTINVLDLLGNNLKTIEDKMLEQGEHIFTIDLTNFSSGVYYLQVRAGNRLFNEKIVISH